MTKNARHEPESQPFDDEERDIMDPEAWDWDEPIEVHVVGKPGAVLRVRLKRDELLALERIARESGMGPVAFVQKTIGEIIAAHQDGAQPDHMEQATTSR